MEAEADALKSIAAADALNSSMNAGVILSEQAVVVRDS